jgi:hypothetical protein
MFTVPICKQQQFRTLWSSSVLCRESNIVQGKMLSVPLRRTVLRTPLHCSTETTEPTKRATGVADPVEARVRKELESAGIELEQLLNPSKVVNLERKLAEYQTRLAELTSSGNAAERDRLLSKFSKMQRELEQEKRAVMRQWLKNLFVAQGILTAALGGWMAFDSRLPLYVQALGFWMVWLFTIPSLRARKPSSAEKNALNVSFLIAPVMNLVLPVFLKDTGELWLAQILQLIGCYLYYGVWTPSSVKDARKTAVQQEDQGGTKRLNVRLPAILRWLDWGSWR